MATRVLPHVLLFRNVAGANLTVDSDATAVEAATVDQPSLRPTEGLSAAVQAAAGSMRIVRQAIDRFIEADGLERARMRWRMHVTMWPEASADIRCLRPAPSPIGTRFEDAGPRGVRSRLVYAPRLPLDVVDALAGREEHDRTDERTVRRWLAGDEPPGADDGDRVQALARQFGLPPNHVGELLLGALAELVADDLLARVGRGVQLEPTHAQLVDSAVVTAVRRLRETHRLAAPLFADEMRRTRVHEEDAYFACYPEGDTLRQVLCESGVWRQWRQPFTLRAPAAIGRNQQRHVLRAAAACVSPVGVQSLRQLVEGLKSVRVPSRSVALPTLPFLSVQSLCGYVGHLGRLVQFADDGSSVNEVATLAHLAWEELAAHVAAAYEAAQRVVVLALGMRLDTDVARELLLASVHARPVLHLVPKKVEDVASRYHATVHERANVPIEPNALQPRVLPRPTARSVYDTASATAQRQLTARLAALRVDVHALRNRRAPTNNATEGELVERFLELRVDERPRGSRCPWRGRRRGRGAAHRGPRVRGRAGVRGPLGAAVAGVCGRG